ncbi:MULTISPECIES: DMT family transporter [Haloferax]|uniref:EamA family transporter n=1 Tax=Haloferax marinum TaxID=2666143 RepID=A0A6A8G2S1_9EURY|nr:MULTISPECIES: DMT family transporter [Haloferax]KAB1196086.1 DMT family transporter [Haloferax sp. CBA1150]MRW95067.1 EamA family transporter [Haloferax marinum]
MTDRLGTALVVLSALGFGTLGIFGKLATSAGLSIPTVLTFRFLLATVLVWVWLGARGKLRLLSGRALVVGLGLGCFGYATMSLLYFVGLEYLTAGLTGIVLYTYPVFVVALAVAVLDEPVTRRTISALVVALAGVVLITGAEPAGVDPRGVLIVLLAAIVYATYIVVSRKTLSTVDSQTLTAHVLPAATVSFLAFGSATGQLSIPTTGESWLVIGGIAVVATVVPILAFFAGLSRIGASRTSVVSTIEPAGTLALGAIVLGEPVTVVTLAGGALVVIGVLLVES